MKIEHLQYLLEVVECGSFNKAGKRLYMNHQHLRRIVDALEEEIGAKIFERDHQGIRLTKDGELVVVYAGKNVVIVS